VPETTLDEQRIRQAIAAAVHVMPLPLLVSDYETVLFTNDHGRRMLRASSVPDVVGRPVTDWVHADTRAAMAERRPLVLEVEQRLSHVPVKLVGADGAPVTLVAELGPVRFAGRTCALAVFDGCASEADSVAEPFELDPADSTAIFDAIPVCMLVHDEAQILAANAACRRLLCYERAEDSLVGKPIESIVHPDTREAGRVRRTLLARLSNAEMLGIPVKLLRSDGREVRMLVDAMRIDLGDDHVVLCAPSTSR
jgi:PAS domain S-box-containing protein